MRNPYDNLNARERLKTLYREADEYRLIKTSAKNLHFSRLGYLQECLRLRFKKTLDTGFQIRK